MLNIPLFNEGRRSNSYIEELSVQFSIPVTTERDQFDWVLKFEKDFLTLVEVKRPHLRLLYVDLVSIRRKQGSLPISKRGPLARALGRKTKTVIDATAGWGQDTMLTWMMGYQVTAVERSQVMGALLSDGLRRYRQYEDVGGYPAIAIQDARSYLIDHAADCIYLDPMFPPKRKNSPLAKRPLRVLRELVGDDNDRDTLFECAWKAAVKRVVTKRPAHAEPWGNPDQTFGGKLMCYDVYLKGR